MENLLKQVFDKISSYNIFNNLYPGIIFCYILKFMFSKIVFTDNWYENLIICYFIGMILNRIGSAVIYPIMKKFKYKNVPILNEATYDDYEYASKKDSLIITLSEVNNTYRTLLSCFVCALIYKISTLFNSLFIRLNFNFFQKNKDWFILIVLILLFSISYIKQTNYVKKRVESLKSRMGLNK